MVQADNAARCPRSNAACVVAVLSRVCMLTTPEKLYRAHESGLVWEPIQEVKKLGVPTPTLTSLHLVKPFNGRLKKQTTGGRSSRVRSG